MLTVSFSPMRAANRLLRLAARRRGGTGAPLPGLRGFLGEHDDVAAMRGSHAQVAGDGSGHRSLGRAERAVGQPDFDNLGEKPLPRGSIELDSEGLNRRTQAHYRAVISRCGLSDGTGGTGDTGGAGASGTCGAPRATGAIGVGQGSQQAAVVLVRGAGGLDHLDGPA